MYHSIDIRSAFVQLHSHSAQLTIKISFSIPLKNSEEKMASKFFQKVFQAGLLAFTGYELGSQTSGHKEIVHVSEVKPVQTTDSHETVLIISIITIIIVLLLCIVQGCKCVQQCLRAVNQNNEA